MQLKQSKEDILVFVAPVRSMKKGKSAVVGSV